MMKLLKRLIVTFTMLTQIALSQASYASNVVLFPGSFSCENNSETIEISENTNCGNDFKVYPYIQSVSYDGVCESYRYNGNPFNQECRYAKTYQKRAQGEKPIVGFVHDSLDSGCHDDPRKVLVSRDTDCSSFSADKNSLSISLNFASGRSECVPANFKVRDACYYVQNRLGDNAQIFQNSHCETKYDVMPKVQVIKSYTDCTNVKDHYVSGVRLRGYCIAARNYFNGEEMCELLKLSL